MTYYERLKRKRLGDILVDEGLASKESVISALQEQQKTGVLLSEILIENREVNEYDLARVVVEQYQAPFIDLKNYTFHKDLIEAFPARLLHQARVVPLDRFGKQVCFACQEIPNDEVVSRLKEKVEGGLFFYVGSSVEIRTCLHEYAQIKDYEIAEDRAEVADKGAPIAAGDLQEDSAWQELFDAADNTIASELGKKED